MTQRNIETNEQTKTAKGLEQWRQKGEWIENNPFLQLYEFESNLANF